jgi:hypothetical protein
MLCPETDGDAIILLESHFAVPQKTRQKQGIGVESIHRLGYKLECA